MGVGGDTAVADEVADGSAGTLTADGAVVAVASAGDVGCGARAPGDETGVLGGAMGGAAELGAGVGTSRAAGQVTR